MDGGAWWAAVHGVAKSQTWLSDFTFTFHFHALEKEMATHSSVLAWRIPGTGKPGGLPSMGSHRVRHDWSDLAAAAARCEKRVFAMTSAFYWQNSVSLCCASFCTYIFCSQRWRRSIQSAKTRLGAACDSDHELLIPNLVRCLTKCSS